MSILEKSIYVIGPHSTGKTTLVQALRKVFSEDTPILTEVARGVVSRGGYTAAEMSSDPLRCKALQREILQAQYEAEAHYASTGQSFIADRSGVDPIIYAARYINDEAANELCNSSEWQALRERYADPRKSLLVLLEPNMKFWENDGTRMLSDGWQDWWNFKEMFVEFLTRWELPFRVIHTSCENIDERVSKVQAWSSHGLHHEDESPELPTIYSQRG